ncbi:MAG TPA: hypothetical protein VM890_12800 [Longimicrobium sp.]|jgi:hypothetical protein|nr:hypothetical protein [Longimicrobium sp.]
MTDPAPRVLTPLGRQGIALPLALLGLVVVTLLVTTVLLSSGTEFAVSAAQRDASRSLYTANGALEQYVATQAQAGVANRFVEGTASLTYQGTPYTLTLARLVRSVTQPVGTGPMTSDETWSVIAAPTDPGRGVGALLRVKRTLAVARLNVNAGFTSGGNVNVGGSATVSNGATGQVGCDSAATGYSVEVTTGSTVTSGNNNLEGASHVSTTTKAGLMTSVLGIPLNDLALQTATIKFGPLFTAAGKCPDRTGGVCPSWPNNVRPSDEDYSTTGADSIYNWGCPEDDIGNENCTTAGKTRFVIVAIDASALHDSTVTLNGDWGQGVLMVLNGSLNIQGNFVFRGIVLVDKDLRVTGGNGQFQGKLEGTVVAFGENSVVTDNVLGNATIRYNRCSINDAQNAMNNRRIDEQQQVMSTPLFAWYELVR